MNIRLTLTAIAISTIALAGCETMSGKDKMAKPAEAPANPQAVVTTDPVTQADDSALVMNKPASVDQTTMADGDAMMAPSGVAANPQSIVTTDPVTQADDSALVMNQPASVDQTVPSYTTTGAADGVVANPESVVVTDPTTQGNDKELAMNDDDMAANDAAINACFAAGGQVVSWVGDPSGAEQACRREDGLEYRLADAQYYQ